MFSVMCTYLDIWLGSRNNDDFLYHEFFVEFDVTIDPSYFEAWFIFFILSEDDEQT